MENPAVMFRVLTNSRPRSPIFRLLPSAICLTSIAALLAGCVEPAKPVAGTRVKSIGGSFTSHGRVAFHQGQPCASQIMFDFRGAGSAVWLAAPMRESRLLTEAANCNCPVQISGRWRRGLARGCSYVQVTSVDLMK